MQGPWAVDYILVKFFLLYFVFLYQKYTVWFTELEYFPSTNSKISSTNSRISSINSRILSTNYRILSTQDFKY